MTARTATRKIGTLDEDLAVRIAIGNAYRWLREHGNESTLLAVASRLNGYKTEKPGTLGADVATWLQDDSLSMTETRRRYRIAQRAYRAVIEREREIDLD